MLKATFSSGDGRANDGGNTNTNNDRPTNFYDVPIVDCNNNNNNTKKSSWNKMIDRLKAYKEKHGNCRVPAQYKDDDDNDNDDDPRSLSLFAWVDKQRQLHIVGGLSKDRVDQLDTIGFVWKIVEPSTSWDNMFQCLLEHKRIHGNCMVPIHYKENPRLGRWVRMQRSDYMKNKLTTTQVQRLETVGFKWPGHMSMCNTIESLLQTPPPENKKPASSLLQQYNLPSPATECFNAGTLQNPFLQQQQLQPSLTAPQEKDDEQCNPNINNKATARLQSFLSESIDNKIDMNLLSWDMAISSDISSSTTKAEASAAVAEDEEWRNTRRNRNNNNFVSHHFHSDGAFLSSSSSLLRSKRRKLEHTNNTKYTNLSELSEASQQQQRHHRRKSD